MVLSGIILGAVALAHQTEQLRLHGCAYSQLYEREIKFKRNN